MIGITTDSGSTLVDRALRLLRAHARSASELATDVLGLPMASPVIAERLVTALLGADPRVRQRADGRWEMVAQASGSPLLDECAFAVVDVETTGMRPGIDGRITEIAVVVVQGERREVVFESLVNPECPIPPRIAELTGITQAMVSNAPTFAAIVEPVLAALAGRIFVAHNARFDWAFVTAEVQRVRGLTLDGPKLCTVRLARRLFHGEQSYGLDHLAHRFGLEFPMRHRAAGDAIVTAMLLGKCLGAARARGSRSLADLEALLRLSVHEASP